MEKINIAELLNDCPKGMELNCTMYDTKVFYQGLNTRTPTNPIVVQTEHGFEFELTQYGQIHNIVGSKCVIFPKGKTTWEGFERPFKDGDVISNRAFIAIFHKLNNGHMYYHCWYNPKSNKFKAKIDFGIGYVKEYKYAVTEEKQKLFDAIKANGYKWNDETKTLEKLPRFKVGDRIIHKNSGLYCTLEEYSEGISAYRTNIGLSLTHKDLEQWELAPNKFDITTLKPFDKVLVAHKKGEWHIQFFEKYSPTSKFPFICIGGSAYQRCVPYGDNKHLMGTTNDCDDYYKTWE